jgi:hypothetical protein
LAKRLDPGKPGLFEGLDERRAGVPQIVKANAAVKVRRGRLSGVTVSARMPSTAAAGTSEARAALRTLVVAALVVMVCVG